MNWRNATINELAKALRMGFISQSRAEQLAIYRLGSVLLRERK